MNNLSSNLADTLQVTSVVVGVTIIACFLIVFGSSCDKEFSKRPEVTIELKGESAIDFAEQFKKTLEPVED